MAEPTHPVAQLLAEHGPSSDDIRAHLQHIGVPEESPLEDEMLYPAVEISPAVTGG
ncbi:hypothetical protein [Mycobacterium sp. Root265]|uniref:hypothetical protein n=1 Tax=Mycobacterium sp. Root265 TaxID=1736504 RepID=UPI000B031CED|nr:hypothetical protein [Mycobacterium sp. Root265]